MFENVRETSNDELKKCVSNIKQVPELSNEDTRKLINIARTPTTLLTHHYKSV